MAIDKKIASGLSAKQLARLDEMVQLVSGAEATKDAPTPVADFVKIGKRVCDFDVANMPEGLRNVVTDAQTAMASLITSLSPAIETVDRTRGDLVASILQDMANKDALEDDAVPFALDLVARWVATKPQRASSGEAPADLGFKVVTKCDRDGCKWDSETQKDNLNSARHQAIVHAREEHSEELSIRKGGNKEQFDSLTSAFSAVLKGEQESQAGADFTIRRAG